MSNRNFAQAAQAVQILNAIRGNPTPRIEQFVHFTTKETMFRWEGAVPMTMVWMRKDDKKLTTQEMQGIIKFGAISKVHKARSFRSKQEAIEFGAKFGIII
ncbi:MAG: hypothetical protein ACXAEN_24090 [Candidatus Thorarchaeota archaeon]|jgi:hypothetical protein